MPSVRDAGKFAPRDIGWRGCTSSALGQPARSATSTSRSELELLGAPTTSMASQRAAMALTASWRLVVA